MEITLVLNDRLYDDIDRMSKSLNISVNDYLIEIIEDGFYTDKYGDLNKILNNKKEAAFKEKLIENITKVDDKKPKEKKEDRRTKEAEVVKCEKTNIADSTEDEATEKIKKRVSRTRTIKSK